MSTSINKNKVRVADIVPLNDLVTRFEFERINGQNFPPFSGGAHCVVEMRDGNITKLNPYSLMSDPAKLDRYCVSIRRDDNGRGGSLFMHNKVKIGDEMVLSNPINLFALDLRAKKHLLIAGGIGITPFIAQIKQIDRMRANWELHYGCQSKALGSYSDELTLAHPNDVHMYYSDQKHEIKLEKLLNGQPLGTHVYVCGPKGMISWVLSKAAELGWPRESVHHEEFLAPQSGKKFEVKLAISNKTIQVGQHESLLEAIERENIDAPYLCRGGACGQCETDVIDYDGKFIHRDHWLADEDHNSGKKIMPCVSRFEGKTLVLNR